MTNGIATILEETGRIDALRVEVAPFGIRVVVVEPGTIRTEWNDIARERVVAAGLLPVLEPEVDIHAAGDEANARLTRNPGLIASFSRALLDGLTLRQTDAEFDRALDASIESIHRASIN